MHLIKLRIRQTFEQQRSHEKSVVAIVRRSAKTLGIWQDTGDGQTLWANLARFTCLVMIVVQFITLILAKDDISTLFECFSVLTFCCMGFLKLNSLRVYDKEWQAILSKAESLEKRELNPTHVDGEYESDEDDTEHDNLAPRIILTYSRSFSRTETFLRRVYIFTLIMFVIAPFIEYEYLGLSGYPHFLAGWSPLDNLGFVGYATTVAFEMIAAVYFVLIHVAFDVTSVGMMIFLCGQFTLLRERCSSIGGKGKEYLPTRARDARAHIRIVQCHRTHIILVELIKELNKLIKHILGVYFLVAMLTLCSVAVRINSERLSLMQFVSLLQYMAATVTQLYLYCHYGDSVENETYAKMGEGPFAACIWCLSPRVRRELVLLAIGVSHQHQLMAGPFHPLDLPSFVQISRMAYSCYAILRK